MDAHENINYLEFHARDIDRTKQFFSIVFNWKFVDYGPEYTAFSNAGLAGGFFKSDQISSADNGALLIVFYSQSLKETQKKIVNAAGEISKPIFDFPGGRRFHFKDPSGNEFAVWSDK